MSFFKSKLSQFSLWDFIPYCGDPDKTYIITLPDPSIAIWPTHRFSFSFWCLMNQMVKNLKCEIDHEKLKKHIPPPIKIENNTPSSFFLVNNSLFMLIDGDRPIRRYEQWVPHYQKYCTAFFASHLRESTAYIFENCTIPVYSLPATHDPRVPLQYYEHLAHSKAMTVEKDISVFFQGRGNIRPAREDIGPLIQKTFPESYIGFLTHKALSGTEYIDKLSRAKIAWCPRTSWCPPDRDSNTITGRELDAMCLEVMVIKHQTNIQEAEERFPGIHFVQIKNNSVDLIEQIAYYLDHNDERLEIAKQGRLYWERNYSAVARATYLLIHCLEAMGESTEIHQKITGETN